MTWSNECGSRDHERGQHSTPGRSRTFRPDGLKPARRFDSIAARAVHPRIRGLALDQGARPVTGTPSNQRTGVDMPEGVGIGRVRRALKLPWFTVPPRPAASDPAAAPPTELPAAPTAFEDPFLRRLERLRVVARRQHGAISFGGRRSRLRGTSIEFADYREYAPGDDPRSIDWNIYGRSDRLVVKLREDEESLAVYVVVDVSRSMDWGVVNKLGHARRLAAAVGYVGLCASDTVTGVAIADRVVTVSTPLRGRASYPRLFGFFGGLAPAWKTDLGASLRGLAAGHRPRGLVVVISDLLSPGAHDGLHALVERGYEAVVAHVIDHSEVDPDLDGDLDLYDRETGEVVRVAADASLGARYRERVGTWIAEQEALCARRQIRYVPVNTAVGVEDFLFHDARARRIVA